MSLTLLWVVPQAISDLSLAGSGVLAQELEELANGTAAQGGEGLGSLPERVRDHD